ncbi:MAG: methyltransferase [Candidatus Eremiobacteraeota bacterium]|nr:methyltransferase [Candidatus Eremiobacteraeota bacterium]MCW5866237.1 methyltransferase [Candidatus Eremiobacteraeota bacterium]
MQETLDHLAGAWKIYQLKGGHRFSADDVLTAWTAARVCPEAREILDLGSGLGSVGLLALWRLPAAVLTGVEVQQLSYQLALKTVEQNQLQDRVRFLRQDLRQPLELGKFPLVTGSPPYFPPGRATVSPHPQRAAARCELHGDVFDYGRVAAEHLLPDGRFVFVHAAGDPRPEQAIDAAGLRLLSRQAVFFRAHLEPTVALFVCGFEGERKDPAPFVIRDSQGRWTEEYLAMRAEMGTAGLRRSP